jgi:hypothetical protein
MYLSKGVLEINIIVTGATKGDQFDLVLTEMVQHVLVDLIINECADGIITVGQLNGLFAELGLEVFYVKTKGFVDLVERASVIWFGIKKCDLFHGSPPFVYHL